MNVLPHNAQIKIKSLSKDGKNYAEKIKKVNLLGYEGKLKWKEAADGLTINFPKNTSFNTAVVFEIE